VTSQSYPLESVARTPLPESHPPHSLALQTAEPLGCESSPTGMDYTSGDEGVPSGDSLWEFPGLKTRNLKVLSRMLRNEKVFMASPPMKTL